MLEEGIALKYEANSSFLNLKMSRQFPVEVNIARSWAF